MKSARKPSLLRKIFGAPGEAPPTQGSAPEPKRARTWWSRLRDGLSRSSSSISSGVTDLFTKRRLDNAVLEQFEDILIQADLGTAASARIVAALRSGRFDKEVDPETVRQVMADEIDRTLAGVAQPLDLPAGHPAVILVVGVNGSGKTTTIGKLAAKFTAEGKSVLLAAGDTFRAAAVEQLRIWAGRAGAGLIARDEGADAASLAFDAMNAAVEAKSDVLIIDTAGRLQNRTELMAELEKLVRAVKKVDPSAPHAVLLIIDATVGQNALSQVQAFQKTAGVTGLVVTKLDGTARGGILVAIVEKFRLPVHFIGVGESVEDLESFTSRDFARAIAGFQD